MKKLLFALKSLIVLSLLLSACSMTGAVTTSTLEPLAPAQHVENALQWLQTHAMLKGNVDWDALRSASAGTIAGAKTTADTIPVICEALRHLHDGNAWMLVPGMEITNYNAGYTTLYPDNRVIISIDPSGPAVKAGLMVGDVIVERNGQQPKPYNDRDLYPPCNTEPIDQELQENLIMKRKGKTLAVTVTKTKLITGSDPYLPVTGQQFGSGAQSVGYLELTMETGSHVDYATDAQKLIRRLDQASVCGWAIDLRRNMGGDLWSYIAALGPILGEGDLGGFVYQDGTREPWVYRDGKVYWDKEIRSEGTVKGPIYEPRQTKPVALLISPATQAATELILVTFQGRPDVRSFGEPTRGLPTLMLNTTLSDGVRIFISGANAFDRTGKTYSTSIAPDLLVTNDWSAFGTAQDPVIQAATQWLQSQPACSP
jgi:C-terminal processing protease CtpA/Prc